MTDTFPGILTLALFLCSIIFIISAYLLQRLSVMCKWKSPLLLTTKNMFTTLSVLSVLGSVSIYLIIKPF